MRRRFLLSMLVTLTALFAGAVWAVAERLEDTDYVPLDHAAINYADGALSDPSPAWRNAWKAAPSNSIFRPTVSAICQPC